ncbi:DUF3168 domain-containing protein [Sedimentibacter hydroxybenzoicus DSM 7310]|uniref:DUF3168 domain-containing protein n=1 Tax=Sedimentibacter hydroxybenzoicus DSM 7310 TaxID=1123245 RepID=A0A974GWA5_SEDHY|nr:DUF3168 domain-containing protein [Sedimentibacter hydroxybenzoicus]NYB73855.1 DUF3168 domain-containing protein [Sedimentibacter hydroxybenzoicus DSM 7310]
MYQFVRNVLMDKEITDLTADKKVYLIKGTNATAPYVVYTFIDEWGAEFAENEEIATNYNVQVDIFSKGDFTELANKIKVKMKDNDFYRTSANDFYENDTQLYHCVLRFNYTKERD